MDINDFDEVKTLENLHMEYEGKNPIYVRSMLLLAKH